MAHENCAKRMPYSLYKSFYSQLPAEGYDPKTKTIMVVVPAGRKQPFPREWRRSGNHYFTQGGCEVVYWGTGYAENFLVRRVCGRNIIQETIVPGIDARKRVLECVARMESGENL